jgi:hypothetical protein
MRTLLSLILGQEWLQLRQQAQIFGGLKRTWAPVLCAGLAYGASYIPSPAIRWTTTGMAVILFLIAGVDVALGLVEADHGPFNPLRPTQRVPVTFFHIALTAALGAIYTFLLLGALQPLVSMLTAPTPWTLVITVPVTGLIACLVAWRNVRLWAHEGAEYEDLLNERQHELEEKERLKQMRLPESSWDHPPR